MDFFYKVIEMKDFKSDFQKEHLSFLRVQLLFIELSKNSKLKACILY